MIEILLQTTVSSHNMRFRIYLLFILLIAVRKHLIYYGYCKNEIIGIP